MNTLCEDQLRLFLAEFSCLLSGQTLPLRKQAEDCVFVLVCSCCMVENGDFRGCCGHIHVQIPSPWSVYLGNIQTWIWISWDTVKGYTISFCIFGSSAALWNAVIWVDWFVTSKMLVFHDNRHYKSWNRQKCKKVFWLQRVIIYSICKATVIGNTSVT